jgi:hypothetical protein
LFLKNGSSKSLTHLTLFSVFLWVIVILNLGAPLDYHAILGAGLFTAIYILSRAFGKYFGARLGAKATGMPKTVQKYLGLTLLRIRVCPLFLTVAVSLCRRTKIIQGTIAAAAVIYIAKKGFEWAAH